MILPVRSVYREKPILGDSPNIFDSYPLYDMNLQDNIHLKSGELG
jgi:hypothetical protein